eukprot:TRINITY_DN5811_c0_g4_i1.p1 TRINITY_DN5811_c0_g4~~TRINITY_DN5811_c0_g4_i1.p1  ORF type:complete len:702 (-),score=285.54 TRINITY_DN5811_c0_g4_i1:19-2124(-)
MVGLSRPAAVAASSLALAALSAEGAKLSAVQLRGAAVAASSESDASENAANPIRKVVNLLEAMEKKIGEEGEKEEELYKKYRCYCSNGDENLSKSIDENTAKVPQVSSEISAKESQKAQLQEDLKQHQGDRADAKDNMAQATEIRSKEAAAFKAEKTEYESNLSALGRAIAAISRGMAGGFLQTPTAGALQKLVPTLEMNEEDRKTLLVFLSGTDSSDYSPQSGEITGILKQIEEDMQKSLDEATATEKASISSFEALIAAKKKEVLALTKAIEDKSKRVGELAVEVATAKNDLSDAQKALEEDTKFLADLKGNCDAKKKDWEERSTMRSEELKAISETIGFLNNDATLELFKKTLPSAASLVQVRGSRSSERQKALSFIQRAQQKTAASGVPRQQLDFIALAIEGKKLGLDKVMKMIDDMVGSLKNEQVEDDNKKEYCSLQFDETEDKKKGLERTSSDHATAIAEAEETVAALKDEIKSLQSNMKAAVVAVADAGRNRKAENTEFRELMSSNTAAKEVLGMAINRLNQYYNPRLAKKADLVQVKQHTADTRQKEDPGPAPETYGEFQAKTEESGGVIQMIKLLVKDLDKEMTIAETDEENSQKAYENTMKEAAEKRKLDEKSAVDNQAALAAAEEELQDHKEGKASTDNELMATNQYMSSLHAECDWLVKYYDVRKQARAEELDALKNAKAVLSGADYSL